MLTFKQDFDSDNFSPAQNSKMMEALVEKLPWPIIDIYQ